MKVKEETEKAGLKLNIQKTKIMESDHITSWQRDGETMETAADFIFLGFPYGSAVMRETWVQSWGWEDPLEKEKTTQSSILAWRITWAV